MTTRPWLSLIALGASSCMTLDALLPLHSNIPCSEVTEDTCAPTEEDYDPYWDAICTPCEDSYAWDQDYEWRDITLDTLSEIRAIDPAAVVDMPHFCAEAGYELAESYEVADGMSWRIVKPA